MNKGFVTASVLLVVVGVLVLGGIGYITMNPQILQAPTAGENEAEVSGESEISWRLTNEGEVDGTPYTNVAVVVDGMLYEMGRFMGSCSEVAATGGIDGTGLLAGELSAMQCWFAGGGNEIGVFAHEDGGYDLMVGELGEGEEGSGVFRGNFEIKNSTEL